MKIVKLICKEIKNKENTNRKINGIYDCLGYSFDKSLGIIFNPVSKKVEVWSLTGMEEVK